MNNACFTSNFIHALKPISGTTHTAATVSNSVVTGPSLLTLAATTEFVVMQVNTDTVRHTFDGTAPTTSLGFLRAVNEVRVMSKSEWNNSKFIRVTNDATLQLAQMRAS